MIVIFFSDDLKELGDVEDKDISARAAVPRRVLES